MRAGPDRGYVERGELIAQLILLVSAQRGDQLVVVELEDLIDVAAFRFEVSGHAGEQPGPGDAAVACAHGHAASPLSAALRWRRLSAVSTSAWVIRPWPSRSAIVCATRNDAVAAARAQGADRVGLGQHPFGRLLEADVAADQPCVHLAVAARRRAGQPLALALARRGDALAGPR